MFARALDLSADSLILDLEDSVPPGHKAAARDAVCQWISTADFAGKECLVRINPQDSAWGRDDLDAVLAATPDGLVLPKVVTRSNVDAVDQIVTAAERDSGLQERAVSLVLIATELPEAVFHLHELAINARVDAMTWGAEDLSGALGSQATRDELGNYLDVFRFVRAQCLLAAAAADVQAIDAVFVDYKNSKGLEKECREGAQMGYTGKITIHPDQIEIVNSAFTPTQHAIDEAQALIGAFEESSAEGKMAFSFNGQMVDVPHLKRARRILALAAKIAGQTG